MPDPADNRTVPLLPDQLPAVAADPGAQRPKFGPPAAAGEVGTLGPYRVLQELGKGGMGAVYLALDTRLDRKLALKVMLPAFAADAAAKERFLREARAAAKISHDNVVTVFEADERDGVPYIAMQFLQGYPLDQFLRTKGTPPLAHAVRIGREAALGLAAAHELGLIHRDIKPANLWLEAPNGRVKVLDFGLARPVEAAGELTASGAVMGTPAYMAPEQARGLKVDHRADLWSLGVVLYRLTTGRAPFDGATAMAVVMALGNDDPTSIRELNPGVPEPLADLIHQLLAKKPEQRPASAAEVASRLYAVLAQLLAPPTVQAIPYQSPAASMQITAAPDVFAHLDDGPEEATVLDSPAAEPAARKSGGKGVLLAAVGAAVLAVAVVAAVASQMGKKERPAPAELPPVAVIAPKVSPKVTAKDRDREAAEWVIGRGGWVRANNDPKELRAVTDLPGERFELTWVELQDRAVPDADLERFSGLKGVFNLNLIGTGVTDRGLMSLKNLPALRMLGLSGNTGVTDAGIAHIKEHSGLSVLFLDGTGVTDRAAAHIKELKSLTILQLRDTAFTDTGVKELTGQPELGTLDLTNTKITDAGLEHFKGMPKLTNLNVGAPGVTDAGLVHLKGRPTLQTLSLSGSKVTGPGLSHLRELPALTYIQLVGTPITDAGLAHLKELPALTALEIPSTAVTDVGMAHLKGCQKLTTLAVYHTAITDEGLKHLQALPALRTLNVQNTKVTAKGLEEFVKARPDCKLYYDDALAPNLPVTDRSAAEWVLSVGGKVTVNGANSAIQAVGGLPNEPFTLTGVDLAYREVGDNLSRLKGLKGLTALNLPWAKVTDRGLESLGELPALVYLNLSVCPGVTDAGLAHVKGFKGLTSLLLHTTGVTDIGMEHLVGLTKLTNLNLVGTKVTAAGLVHLKGLARLGDLALNGTAVTDEGLSHLAALDELALLYLTETKVTADGVAKFRAARPNCKVEWAEPKK